MRKATVGLMLLSMICAVSCGGGDSSDDTFVSLKEAHDFIRVSYGAQSECRGHELEDFTEMQLENKHPSKHPAEDAVWGFASCRLLSVPPKERRRAQIYPGDVLTYGIP
jgi:hypothetical protein